MAGHRRDSIAEALRILLPRAPDDDLLAIAEQASRSRGLGKASPQAAAWLTAVSWIRHNLTEYDALLAEGYDRDSARHFTAAEVDAILAEWGCALRVGES